MPWNKMGRNKLPKNKSSTVLSKTIGQTLSEVLVKTKLLNNSKNNNNKIISRDLFPMYCTPNLSFQPGAIIPIADKVIIMIIIVKNFNSHGTSYLR